MNVCSSDTNKNANKTDGWSKFLHVFSMRRGVFSKIRNRTFDVSY